MTDPAYQSEILDYDTLLSYQIESGIVAAAAYAPPRKLKSKVEIKPLTSVTNSRIFTANDGLLLVFIAAGALIFAALILALGHG